MADLAKILKSKGLQPPPTESEGRSLAGELGGAAGLDIYPASVTVSDGMAFFLGRTYISTEV